MEEDWTQKADQELQPKVSEPLIADSGRFARFIMLAATKIGPGFAALCLLFALVAFVKWPDPNDGSRKSSLLDRYAKHRRLAELDRRVEAGDAEGAASIWKTTLPQETNNVTALRGFFDHDARLGGALVERIPEREALVASLVKLGGTNQHDMLRVLRLRDRRLEWNRIVNDSPQISTDADSEAKGIVARAYLAMGDVLAFDQLWSRSSAALQSDPSMKLWRLAANALLRDGADAAQAKAEIAATLASSKNSTNALDALLFLAFQSGDMETHRTLLESHRITGRRRIKHWMDHAELLARSNDTRGVDDVLDGLALDRADPDDVGRVARRLMQLGMYPQVTRMVERRQLVNQSSQDLSVIAGFASLLSENWEQCNNIAIGIQRSLSVGGNAQEVAHFLRACAAWGLGNEAAATAAFDRVVTGSSNDPASLLSMLFEGVRLGAGSMSSASIRQAWILARDSENLIGDSAAYWRTRSELAGYAMQTSDMLLAARTALQLEPGSPASIASMTRALLLAPTSTPEILSLSASLMDATPVPAEWRIVRAQALASANQLADAKATLSAMKPSTIPTGLMPSMNVAWLEVHMAAKDWDAARKALSAIPSRSLEPLMQAKVDRLAAKIPKI